MELPELETGVYCPDLGREEPRTQRHAVLTAQDTLALDTALGEGGNGLDRQIGPRPDVLSRGVTSERALNEFRRERDRNRLSVTAHISTQSTNCINFLVIEMSCSPLSYLGRYYATRLCCF